MDYLVLNADEKAVLLKELKGLYQKAGLLHDMVNKDKLSKELSTQIPFVLETHFLQVAESLDYDSHLKEESEKRYIEIRQLNEKIRELEKQLADNKDVDGLKQTMKHLVNKISDWWSTEGFNHITDTHYTNYGSLNVSFCFMLDHIRSFSKTPITDVKNKEDYIRYLKEKGFEFAEKEKDRYDQKHLIDNPTNRKLLIKMLKERFPSIIVHSFDNKVSYETEDYLIQHIQCEITDLKDI